MIIYQVSCTMSIDLAEKWQNFFLEKHLDDVVNTGYFHSYSFRRVIDDSDTGEVTFIAEYQTDSLEKIEAYNQHAAPALKKEVIDLFEGQFTASRQLFEIIDQSA